MEVCHKPTEEQRGRMPEAAPARYVDYNAEAIFNRAVAVLGNVEKARRWFETPVRALNFAKPASLLGNSEGQGKIIAVLTRLEHGVY